MTDKPTDVRVRRAPKFGRFAIIGGAVGAITTFVATALFPVDPNVGFWALFAYFALYGVSAGIVLGLLLAFVFDVVASRRARTVIRPARGVVEDDRR